MPYIKGDKTLRVGVQLRRIQQQGFSAKLIIGPELRCYLYPTGADPEMANILLGSGCSIVSLPDAITLAFRLLLRPGSSPVRVLPPGD